MTDTAESITCPRCKRTSYNPNDVLNRYCGACFRYHPETETEIMRASFRAGGMNRRGAEDWAENIGVSVIRCQCLCGDPKCDWSCPKGADHPMDRT